jgi:hypothetical protein
MPFCKYQCAAPSSKSLLLLITSVDSVIWKLRVHCSGVCTRRAYIELYNAHGYIARSNNDAPHFAKLPSDRVRKRQLRRRWGTIIIHSSLCCIRRKHLWRRKWNTIISCCLWKHEFYNAVIFAVNFLVKNMKI